MYKSIVIVDTDNNSYHDSQWAASVEGLRV